MADNHASIDQVLAAVAAQKTQIASMATFITGLRARINQALSGELSPSAQAKLDEAMAEVQGNTRALANAMVNNDDDPANDVDVDGNPIGRDGQPISGDTDQRAHGDGSNAAPASETRLATTTELESTNTRANAGERISFSAHVSPVDHTDQVVTGSVDFVIGADTVNARIDSTGAASVTGPTQAGDYDVTAVYKGDVNFAPSTSEVLEQSILVPEDPQTGAQAGAMGDQSQGNKQPGAEIGTIDPQTGAPINQPDDATRTGNGLNPARPGDQPQQGGENTGVAQQGGAGAAGSSGVAGAPAV